VTFEVVFTSTARRDLQRIPPRIVPAIVEFVYGDLADDPRRVGKPLGRQLAGTYSARRGSYRVLYSVDDDRAVIDVFRVDHRSDVYRAR
jgi:mRNA-degrading endonuclease RelE of RelBE toxin-antitoxin system